jgi:hypothetical protein
MSIYETVHEVEFTRISRGLMLGLLFKFEDFKVKAPDLDEATLLISRQPCLKDKYGSPKMGGRGLYNAICALFADAKKLIATAKKNKHPLNTLLNWLDTPFIGIPRQKASKKNPAPFSVPEPDQDAAMEDSVADITDVINEPTLPPPPVSAPAAKDQPQPATQPNTSGTPFIGIPRKKACEENPAPVSVPEPGEDAAMEDSVADINDVINEPTPPPPPASAPAAQGQPQPATQPNTPDTPFIGLQRKKASEENPSPVSVPEPEEDSAVEDPVEDIPYFTVSGMQGIRSTPPPPNEPTLTPPPVSARAARDQPQPDNQPNTPYLPAGTQGVSERRWVRLKKREKMVYFEVFRTVVKESTVEGAGLGLFAGEDIPQGTHIGEYGGEKLKRGREEAFELRDQLEDTHLKRLGSIFHGVFFDGRVTKEMPLSYYVDNGIVGSLINTIGNRGSTQTRNVKEVAYDQHYCHPYSPDDGNVPCRLFYITLTALKAGDEIFTDYGPTYRRIHLTDVDDTVNKACKSC